MKTILLLLTVIFCVMAVSSCTNDEMEEEFEIITPEEDTIDAIKKD